MPNLTGLTINPVSDQTILKHGFTHQIILDYTGVAVMTSGTLQAIFPANALAAATVTIPAGTRVERCAINVATAFTFAPGTLVAIIGDDGDDDRYLTSTTLKTAAWTETVPATTTTPYIYNAANTIDIIVTAGAGALTSVTAGSLEIYLKISDLNALRTGVER
jgi:hypothetical protein